MTKPLEAHGGHCYGEAGLPDRTIMAQVGHISPEMLKTYSHIRRQALKGCRRTRTDVSQTGYALRSEPGNGH